MKQDLVERVRLMLRERANPVPKPRATLPGPSRTIIVEPLHDPATEPAPAEDPRPPAEAPQRPAEPVPAPEREPVQVPA